ncbi:MAG: DUF616 domain-containing protein [Spirochaetaceae bacterium]
MKLVVYTSIFGNYDNLKEIPFKKKNVNYICFTDNEKLKSKTWQIRHINPGTDTPTDKNRKIKILVLDYLSEYDKSIYIDGNMEVLTDLEPFFKNLDNYPMATIRHSRRNCIYVEVNECLKIGKVKGNDALEQVNRYREDGFPENFGMTENGVLIRDHNNPELKVILDYWWEQYINGVKRDQISLPYITWKYDLKIKALDFNTKTPNPYIRWRQHDSNYKGLKKLKYDITRQLKSKEWRKEIKNAIS